MRQIKVSKHGRLKVRIRQKNRIGFVETVSQFQVFVYRDRSNTGPILDIQDQDGPKTMKTLENSICKYCKNRTVIGKRNSILSFGISQTDSGSWTES